MQIILQNMDAVCFFCNAFDDIFRKTAAGRSAAASAVESRELVAKFLDLIHFFHTIL